MTADDPDRPRKTLTLNKTARRATPSEDDGIRKRGGARARSVALKEHEREKLQRTAEPEAGQPRGHDVPRRRDEGTAPRGAGRPQYRGEDGSRGTGRPQQRSESGPRGPGRPQPRGEGGPRGTGRPQQRSEGGPRGTGRPQQRSESGPRGTGRPQQRSEGGPRGTGRPQQRSEGGVDRPSYKRNQPRQDRPQTRPLERHHDRPDAIADQAVESVDHSSRRDEDYAAQRQPRAPRQAEVFTVFTPCPQGIEEALAAELQALGFEDAQVGRAGCRFTTDWHGVQRANLYSRLATRVLVQVAQGPVQHEDDLLDLAYATPWERWFGAEHTLRVDTSAIKSPMRSLQFCNLRVKDGICDRLLDREGARPDIDTVRPDARVHSFLTADTATLYLDTSGESLFKRGWRLDKGEAPLRENLAAGMLALAGWDPSAPLLDPFCGSGTILIEAAWIALGVPPGISRPFGFERLRDHDANRWHDLKDDARAHILPQLDTPLYGCDLDPEAVAFARNNAERAWLTEGTIQFAVADARDLEAPEKSGWIVTNPPYGERMPAGADDTLWRDWATCLKRQFGGWQMHVISSDMALPQQMRLKPSRRTPLYNGALDCRLFSFELVSAGYRDKPGAGARHDDHADDHSGDHANDHSGDHANDHADDHSDHRADDHAHGVHDDHANGHSENHLDDHGADHAAGHSDNNDDASGADETDGVAPPAGKR
jgi:putative N6-adenine-specific DNA methylase